MAFRRCVHISANTELGFPLEVVAHQVIALLEAPGGSKQTYHIEVEDRLGFEMVSNGGMISLKDQDILQTQGRGAEEFGLERQSISIATGEIEDHLHPFRLQQGTHGKGPQPHDGILKLWHIDPVHTAFQEVCILKNLGNVVSFGGLEFSNHYKFS
jgi:hypothetical protein